MEKYEKCFKVLRDNGADLVKTIDVKTIVTAPWTFYLCKFGCRTFGKSYCCPPNTPSWRETQEIIDCFHEAVLFRCHEITAGTPLAVMAARELFLEGYYRAVAFGSGPCKRCETCNPQSCNHPGKTVPAMEACGIDVYATVRANDIELHTLKDPCEEQTYFGLVLTE